MSLGPRLIWIWFLCIPIGFYSCNSPAGTSKKQHAAELDSQLIHDLNYGLTRIVSQDKFSPPVASRIYAYTQLAAYEAVRLGDINYQSFSGLLNGWKLEPSSNRAPIYPQITLLEAFTQVAKHLVYRDHLVDELYQQQLTKLALNLPRKKEIEASRKLGHEIAKAVIEWADQDGYNRTRNLPKYETQSSPSAWQATAPTFGEALEPHWPKLRPFVMDSASQFRRSLPVSFSVAPGTAFYQSAMNVYEKVKATVPEDIQTAVYWDCNPATTMVDGHLMQVREQNTPAGHWLGINQIVCAQRNVSLLEACAINAQLAIGLADGFIAAWDTKYTHELIRPETYINTHVDPDWKPKLESPLFPEYTSAHSLISAVAAQVLSHAHGANFAFTDTTNVRFGLPERSFDNFRQAAEEAAYSRLIGGIHYEFACKVGLEQGEALGEWVLDKTPISLGQLPGQ